MKRKIAILGTVIVLLGCSSATIADDKRSSITIKHESISAPKALSSVLGAIEYLTMLEKQQEEEFRKRAAEVAMIEALAKNKKAIEDQVAKLYKYVDKTRYVFSGSSPKGWDCSGLTVWFYESIGIKLEHSATKQARYAGEHVDNPKIGDIVAFNYVGSKQYYHVGIYIGDNNIIHAGFKPGTKTEVIAIDSPYFKNSETSFIRVIEN